MAVLAGTDDLNSACVSSEVCSTELLPALGASYCPTLYQSFPRSPTIFPRLVKNTHTLYFLLPPCSLSLTRDYYLLTNLSTYNMTRSIKKAPNSLGAALNRSEVSENYNIYIITTDSLFPLPPASMLLSRNGCSFTTALHPGAGANRPSACLPASLKLRSWVRGGCLSHFLLLIQLRCCSACTNIRVGRCVYLSH